ncbi:MAG: DUF2867 domain-containing protein [Reichenbachiella sp.]|uniref:DUF2867 domain-containing protein n=1 Tax=Reichenbachiella sp. TaxID=2184521 RepID=UPI00329937D9
MKSLLSIHQDQPWLTHQILNDFRIEDVWLLPIKINETQKIGEVQNAFVEAMKDIGTRGTTGRLFQLRNWLGKIFHWEDDFDAVQNNTHGVLKQRYARHAKIQIDQLPVDGHKNFSLVYLTEEESLLEIENKTVQAAIHFGKIKTEIDFNVQMVIFVKPKGLFGQLYMLAIKPFRHWIVYPTLLKTVAQQWKLKYA